MTYVNYTSAVFIVREDVRAVKVTYEKETGIGKPIQEYTYKTFDKTIKEGDYVVVPTRTRHGMTVCKVTKVDVRVDLSDTAELKWIVSKVDHPTYEEIIKWEETIVEKMHAATDLAKRKEMEKNLRDLINGSLDEIKALPLSVVDA